jgi:hypothetical protein
MSDKADHKERLLIHRELQFLRAAAWRPKKGQGKRKAGWVRQRAWKLDQARREKS